MKTKNLHLNRLTGKMYRYGKAIFANLLFGLTLLLTASAGAQTQVTNASGTAAYGTTSVTATAGGGASSLVPCGTALSPYFLINDGDSYSYAFSSPVSSITVKLLFAPTVSTGAAHFTVNGTSYTLTAANLVGIVTPNCGDNASAAISGGDITDNASSGLPTAEIVIPGPITTFSVSQVGANSIVYGLYFTINVAPTFVAGATQTLNMCEGSPASLNTALAVDDPNSGQTETWSVATAPAHGTLAATYSVTSTGSTLTPTGLTYTPNTGYTGTDAFSVQVSDGIETATTAVSVNVAPRPVVTGTTGSATCVGVTGTVSATPGANAGINWYDAPTAGTLLGTGNTLSIANPTATKDYYAEAFSTYVLATTTAAGNGQDGVMFDVSVTNSINVSAIDVYSNAGTANYAVYYRTGTMVGNDASLAGWTLLGSYPSYVLATDGMRTLTLPSTLSLAAGQTYGFYITANGGAQLKYSNLGSLGTTFASDANLAIKTGYGKSYPLSSSAFSPRTANVSFTYLPPGGSCPSLVRTAATLTVNPLPAAITGTTEICSNAKTTLSDIDAGGTWSSGDISKATIGATDGVLLGVSAGTATISYTDATTGCHTTTVVTLDAAPAPISGTPAVCLAATTSLTDADAGGTWSSSSTSVATVGTDGVVSGITTGITTIAYTLPNTCTTNVNVTVNPNPTAIMGTPVVCSGATVTLSDNTTGGTWSSSNTAIAAIGSAGGELSGISGGNATITYMLTATGCYATTVATVNLLPSLTLGANPAVCAHSTTALLPNTSLSLATAGSSTYSIVWDAPAVTAGFADAIDSVIPAGPFVLNVPATAAAAAYTGSVSIDNGTCVSNSYPFTVTVLPLDSLTTTLTPAAVCEGSLFHYEPASHTLGADFAWGRDTVVGIDNSPNSGVNNIDETLSNTTTAPLAVTYVYTVTLGTCPTIQHVVVTINPLPVLNSTSPALICNNTTYVHIPTSATPGTTFTWSRDTVVGISTPMTSGADSVHETLTNTDIVPLVVTYIDTLRANGCMSTEPVMVTVDPTPVMSISLSPAAICDSTLFSYPAASATPGVSFTWTRAAVAGISNTAASGTDSPEEYLKNTTANALSVAYVYTLGIDGCTNVQTVNVAVNATPKLSNPVTSFAVCDSSHITFTPTSATTGATFAWVRPFVSGIGALAASGSGSIDEYLKNNSYFNTSAVYQYTITANGCSNTKNVTFTIHPTPVLTTSLADVVCSGTMFNYTPLSNTPLVGFDWTRAAVTGVSPATGSGTSSIHEVLTSTSLLPTPVTYVYTLDISGCKHSQNIIVTTNPLPQVATIATAPGSALCANTMYTNFGASAAPATGTTYTWSATNATIWATGIDKQYCLVNFPDSGNATVTLTASSTTSGCNNTQTYPVTISATENVTPYVTYSNHEFVCQLNDVDGYQWGYDDKHTLDSTAFAGQIDQNLFVEELDIANKYYWVMTTKNGCTKKAYYNVPTGITTINTEATAIKVYPNPTSDRINVSVTNATGNMTVEVFNMLGQKISATPVTGDAATISVANLSAGVYIVDCLSNGEKVASARFIKN